MHLNDEIMLKKEQPLIKHCSLFQELGFEVCESETGEEFIQHTTEFDCVFVLEDFKDEIFNKLHKADVRIVGPPVIIKCAREDQVNYCNYRLSVYVHV